MALPDMVNNPVTQPGGTETTNNLYLADVLLLCVTCQQPIKARINTPQWIRVEWIGPSGECQACSQEGKRQ